jgi:23S rRNA pseudouridine2605 synthase
MSGTTERIAKLLARAGVASRRDAERLIEAGRVTLNGVPVIHPATQAHTRDLLAVDGKIIGAPDETKLWRYNKPAGLVTTARDPQGRPTIVGALPKTLPRLISIGRLDINSEGLLLLTNDGALARYLEHPSQGIARTYRVRAHGKINDTVIADIAKGITIDNISYRPAQVSLDRVQGANCWLTMTLHEGKNREIKRLLSHFGLQVTRLIRIGYGPFEIGSLKSGAIEEVPVRSLPKLLPGYFGR